MAPSERDDQESSGSVGAQGPSPVDLAAGQSQSDGEDLTNILKEIPNAWERAQESITQAKRGKTVPLSEL
jgi:hypothetical protein